MASLDMTSGGPSGLDGYSILSDNPPRNPLKADGKNGDWWINQDPNKMTFWQKRRNVWIFITTLKAAAAQPGDQGPPGTSVLVGSAAPGALVGQEGDVYIRTTAAGPVLYGPKASASWPFVTNLYGTAVRTGAAAPTGATGNEGDMYIHLATTGPVLYGPKSGTTWPLSAYLVGSAPAHEIDSGAQTIRFRNPDGTWGAWINLANAATFDATAYVKKDGSTAFTGKAPFVASAAGFASARFAPGVAPTAPVDGDVWVTSGGLFVRVNGVTMTVQDAAGVTAAVASLTGSIATKENKWTAWTTITAGTLADRDQVRVDSAAAARTVSLPPTPATGVKVRVQRVGVNTVTMARNGSSIYGLTGALAEDFVINRDFATLGFEFDGTAWVPVL
jgi:hypothetical protein